eukprot:gene6868-13919_t
MKAKDDGKLYLDKFVTLPHLPLQRINDDPYPILPNLQHTGIQTTFVPRVESSIMPNGSVNFNSISKSMNESRMATRSLIKLQTKQPPFRKTHRNILDKLLIEIDEKKLSRPRSLENSLLNNMSEMEPSYRLSSAIPMNSSNRSSSAVSSYYSHRLSTAKPIASAYSKRDKEQMKITSHVPIPPEGKVFNKESLFKFLLDTSEPPPSSKKHFGVIAPREIIRIQSPMSAGQMYDNEDWDDRSVQSYTSQNSKRSSSISKS